MKIEISRLEEDDLLLMLKILNADTNLHANVRPLVWLEKKVLAYVKQNPTTRRGERRLSSWSNLSPEETNERALRNNWKRAQDPIRQVVMEERKKRSWACWIPQIVLPAKKAKVVISRPEDLSQWFIARAVQNGQHLRFIRCEQCNKFGLRDRPRLKMKWCKNCSHTANLEQKAKRYANKAPKGSVGLVRRQQLQRRREKLGGRLPTSLSIEAHVLGRQKKPI